MAKPLERIMGNKTMFPTPFVPVLNIKFEDFQKSELVKEEIIEDGFLYRCIAVERNQVMIILKQEVIRLKK